MLLVKFSRNWADEFDVHGAALMDYDDYARVLEWSKECSFHFGTNEGWDDEDLSDGFSFVDVSDLEVALLTKLFPGIEGDFGWGIIPTLTCVEDDLWEAEHAEDVFNEDAYTNEAIV